MSNTTRLDKWLIQSQHFPSRERSQEAIKKGLIFVNGKPITKPAYKVHDQDEILVTGKPLEFVGRGGLKLEKAIREFGLNLKDKRVLDVGASTGGFTDCALQYGAKVVYAIDVGTNQLHPSLSTNDKVHSYEGLHIRDLGLQHLEEQKVDMIVIDVSFISLTQVLPLVKPFLQQPGEIIALIKPQFELEGRIKFKGGIVTDKRLQSKAVDKIVAAATALGFHQLGMTSTEVEDPKKKNIEFLIYFRYH